MTNVLVVGLVIALGLFLGELVYRAQADKARLWGDLSQGVYAVLSLIVVAALAFGGGIWTFIALVFIILYYALARTRADDVRRGLNGGGRA